MRIFLDANVLFSAANPSSATRQLLQMLPPTAELVVNPHVWDEARRNLAIKRPAYLRGLAGLQRHVVISSVFVTPPDIGLPECDIPVLAGAIGSACTHLWTGDHRHFGKFHGKQVAGVMIVNHWRPIRDAKAEGY